MSTSGSNPIQGVQPVTAAELNAHSEQALVQLIYIQAANDMLGGAMATLDSALRTTQSVLNILQALQNLHNQIEVKSRSAFNFPYATGPSSIWNTVNLGFGGGVLTGATLRGYSASGTVHGSNLRFTTGVDVQISAYVRAYGSAASAYFGQSIDPFFAFANKNAPGYSEFLSTLKILKNKLRLEISALTRQTPLADRGDPTTLLGTIRKVYNELPSNFKFATVEKWVVDNYNAHGSALANAAGNIQNDITFAITAAESLNDTQKERVRRFLFIFQEYYQSAAAILSKINQIVEQMAQKISQ